MLYEIQWKLSKTCDHRLDYSRIRNEPVHKNLTISQPRTQGLSSWGEKTLVDAGHVIC
jgi:hypothetical protein